MDGGLLERSCCSSKDTGCQSTSLVEAVSFAAGCEDFRVVGEAVEIRSLEEESSGSLSSPVVSCWPSWDFLRV